MIEDVCEPLAKYRDEFRERFLGLVKETWRELTERSRVDIAANRKTCAEIDRLEAALAHVRTVRTWLLVLGVIGLGIAAFIGAAYAVGEMKEEQRVISFSILAAALIVSVIAFIIRHKKGKAAAELEAKISAEKKVAWSQMECLNRLFTWDIAPRLIEKTVPRLQFDSYFAAKRLADLTLLYNWDPNFNDGKSVLFAQSGVINGNPFVFGKLLEMKWIEKEYTGRRTVSWTVTESNGNGGTRRVTRTETLVARVYRPAPEYDERGILLYGNDAAPNLTFMRRPSELSNAKDGFFKKIRMNHEVNKLKKFSQILDDDSQYTMMSNHEFEALFNTKNRNDEVEFRTLFTPIAQIQMLALLKDTTIGYGDDFSFQKDRKMNYILADHLDRLQLSTDPKQFYDYRYDRAEQQFIEKLTEYFKAIYFAIAPLLVIPLYQQTRTHEDLWKGVIEPGDAVSFWEHEAIANHYGEKRFAHPDCITRSILKTTPIREVPRGHKLAVTASGFRGERRVTTESVRCSNGKYYDVNVEWIEYFPVEKTSEMVVAETGSASVKSGWSGVFKVFSYGQG